MCWAALSATVWTKRSRVRSGAMRAHVERTITLDEVVRIVGDYLTLGSKDLAANPVKAAAANP